MVQLTTSVATPKTPKMAKTKTPKKGSAVNTPAKTEVKTPKQAKNTPAKAAAAQQTPKMNKEVKAKEGKSTPKAAPQTPKNGTASAKKTKKVKTPKQQKPAEDVKMASDGEEAALAQPSPKKSPKKVDLKSEDAEMTSDEDEIIVKPKSGKSASPKQDDNSQVGKFGLFIRGLNYNSEEKIVTKHFSQFGTVTRCAIPRNAMKKNLNKGFGFVEFESQEAVDKALAASHTLDTRTLIVKLNDAESAGKRKRDESQQPGGANKRQKATYDNELFVARLSVSSSKDSIKEHFSKFGEVVSVGLPTKPNTQENKGFAFIAFKEASSLKKAMAESNQVIDSAKITLEPRKKDTNEAFAKPSHPNELFVGGVNFATQKHTLQQHFSKYGVVSNITLPWNKQTNTNKGFGFVSFESAESLKSALEEDHEIDGKKIYAKPSATNSQENGAENNKTEVKKVKAVPAAAKAEDEEEDEEMGGEEAEDEESDSEAEEVGGEDEEDGEAEEESGDDEEEEEEDDE